MRAVLSIADCIFTDPTKIIDTHCHYNLEPFYPDWQPHWQKAQANGVVRTVVASTSEETSRRAVGIAQADENLFALVGVHPSEVSTSTDSENLGWLSELLVQPGVLGIGEIGLDYYWLKPEEKATQVQVQQKLFRAQLALAQKHGGWLSLHIRDTQEPAEKTPGNAYWDTYQIMREFDWSQQPFILHCASGSLEYIQSMLALGAYVGFDGNVTYPKAHHLREIWDLVPADKRVLETDAPYLAPQPSRGKPCEPWMIVQTADFLANYTLAKIT
jgi:TatD DNase family protein